MFLLKPTFQHPLKPYELLKLAVKQKLAALD